jgi:hypothetical protein
MQDIPIRFYQSRYSEHTGEETILFCSSVDDCKAYSAMDDPDTADEENYSPLLDGFKVAHVSVEGKVFLDVEFVDEFPFNKMCRFPAIKKKTNELSCTSRLKYGDIQMVC